MGNWITHYCLLFIFANAQLNTYFTLHVGHNAYCVLGRYVHGRVREFNLPRPNLLPKLGNETCLLRIRDLQIVFLRPPGMFPLLTFLYITQFNNNYFIFVPVYTDIRLLQS